MTNPSTPEVTLFFSIGVVGMDENVTEYVAMPLVEGAEKQLQMKAQIAQMKLSVGFVELMATHFPVWLEAQAKEKGWTLPEGFLE